MDLSEFLLARIAEDEASSRMIADSTGSVCLYVGHELLYDANRLRAECEAKRQIVEDHQWEYADPYESWKGPEYRAKWGDTRDQRNCKRCGGVSHHPNLGEIERRDSWPCTTLRALALPYADHPDYQEAWRP
ncbi:MAG TPA: DUF6221 family protein [Acidimicrobiales bacterium]|nr:DUF6221 family protein [Acidimicrobiales bacterium]